MTVGADRALVIAADGGSDYSIVRRAAAAPAEVRAADELATYLRRMTGANLPVVTDAAAPAEREIAVGAVDRPGIAADAEALGEEGFAIFSSGERLAVVGGGPRGTLYGVYTLLERFGCRFLTKDCEVVPERPALVFSPDMATAQKPAFEYRDVYWYDAFDADFSVKNKINGTGERALDEARGGGIGYGDAFVHTMLSLCPPEEYAAAHPEYYARRERNNPDGSVDCIPIESGGRPAQLCLTNAQVLDIVTERVLALIERDPLRNRIVSVSQEDNAQPCECAACRASDARYGSPAGTLLAFVNEVARRVEAADSDALIDTLAYYHTLPIPTGIVPRDNVVVRVCSIGCCFSHPLDDCGENSDFAEQLRAWSTVSDRIYVWDYTTDFMDYLAPYPNLAVLAENLQLFVRSRVRGVFEQGMYQRGSSGELGDLKSYVLAKLLWNPYEDVGRLVDDFLQGYYGRGWTFVREYIDGLSEAFRDLHNFGTVIDWEDSPYLEISEETWQRFDELWTLAERVTAGDAEALAHVRRARLQMRLVNLRLKRGEFAGLDERTFDERALVFYEDVERAGIVLMSEMVEPSRVTQIIADLRRKLGLT